MEKANRMSEIKTAGIGEIYVCGACGKVFKDPYKVDVSCMLNRVLCKEDSIEYDENGRAIKVEPVEEGREDYKEPKEWWYIDIHGPHKVTNNDEYYQQVKAASKEVGNYFETKEEAELAVRKLKAWKRLKDKGFRFELWDYDLWDYDGSDAQGIIRTGRILFRVKDYEEVDELLDLLFSGGEE